MPFMVHRSFSAVSDLLGLAWDNQSGAPTSNWYRFDAIGVATTLMLASRGGTLDRTVAAAHLTYDPRRDEETGEFAY